MDADEQNVDPRHLCIPSNRAKISEQDTLLNPFHHPIHGRFFRKGSAVVITGLPGIGLLCPCPSVSSTC
jgi:hypothetical protein